MEGWSTLTGVLALLAGGLVLGALAERLRQSAILGYLVAGMLVGPHGLGWVSGTGSVVVLAELGVALLLFSIGLEFSWTRLRALGPAVLGGGAIQVGLTALVGGLGVRLAGADGYAALVLGCMLALSSTAYVLRLLARRAEIDSQHGRLALGVLLVQDVAVVPIVLLVGVVGAGGSAAEALRAAARLLGLAGALVAVLVLVFRVAVPRVFGLAVMRQNRELPLLLAAVSGLGSALAAHAMGVSPAIGAFLAGMMLAESPFATQVRADVGALRTLLMTLFFGSVGLLGDLAWIARHLVPVAGLVAAVVATKAALAGLALRLARRPGGASAAAGLALAQVGEFSFVLADLARAELTRHGLFPWVISVTILTLALTPYLVAWAAHVAAWGRGRPSGGAGTPVAPPDRVLVVGYGPTGQAVARALGARGVPVAVLDLNPHLAATARDHGHDAHVGEATHAEVLEHAGVGRAIAVAVTVPDPATARAVVEQARAVVPGLRVFARARYHTHREDLLAAGAEVAVDEEEAVGRALAEAAERCLVGPPPA